MKQYGTYDFLVIFRQYFSRARKVNCLLATISVSKDLKTKCHVVVTFSYHRNSKATSSENLVTSAQLLVTLATSESQFQAL